MSDDAADSAGRAPERPQGFTPIRDYAVIGDTRTAALVSRTGSVDWLCLPNMHDPAILSGMLDPLRGGALFTGPPRCERATRRYVDGAPVLETRFETEEGVVSVTDFMALPPEDPSRPFHPERRLVRIVKAERGRPRVAFRFTPRPGYGRHAPRLERRGRLGWVIANGRDFLLLQTDLDHHAPAEGQLEGETRLTEGERRMVSLSYCGSDVGVIPRIGPESADEALEETLGWWRPWLARMDYGGPFAEDVARSAMALRLLTFSESGAVLAAATTSLPEAIGAGRNWDYRYCWLRDSSFILRAFLGLGYLEEAQAFLGWLMHATQLTTPRLQTLYDPFGRTDVSERVAPWLEGYRGSAPVNIGNEAKTQLQLDVYGAVLTAADLFVRHGGEIGPAERSRLEGLARVVCEDWTLPDNGIWEMRGGRAHHTYSKAMCWAALDAAVRLKERGLIRDPKGRFAREREEIRRVTLEQGWNDARGAFMGAFGRDWLDASLLLLPRIGFLPADDPRMVSTAERIEAELSRGAHLRRYGEGVDGMASREGAFVACGFWAAEYLARRGDVGGARRRVKAVLEAANDLGLMSEEIDPESGEALGNLPQGFSHTGLINAALAIKEAEEGQEPETT